MTERISAIAERAERAALRDLHEAAAPADRDRLGLGWSEVGGAAVSIAARCPTVVVNRVVGLGVDRPATPPDVRSITARYRAAGVDRFFVHLDPVAAPATLSETLQHEGLAPYHRGWAKFVRGVSPTATPLSELEVRTIGRQHAEWFGRIAAEGFGLAPAWVPVLASLVGRDGWRHYLSFDGDEPAGCAAMRVLDGVAWFDWAATRFAFRRRGSQGAILARRIADAGALGCRVLATATGEAVAGDPQHSYRNLERFGFRHSHTRANWLPQECLAESA